MSGGMTHQQKLESVDDLAALFPSISDDIIVSCLRERFLSDTIYTAVGSHALVALNPHKYVNSVADSVLMQYASEYRNTDVDVPREPHIFQLANNAYYHMRRTTQDQSIVFFGETASGKSENRRLAIKSILELSVPPGKKGSKLSQQIPAAEFVLESFGNARTLQPKRVSIRQIHRAPVQRPRPTPTAGMQPRPGMSAGSNEDWARFEQFKMAMKHVGMSKRHIAQSCQLVAAILHLGNLEFMRDRARNEDAAVVRNTDVLELTAEFLGLQPSALEGVLSYRTKLVKKELCTVFLDEDGAADNRDDLAKTLYSLLFAWINETINQRLCKEDFSTFIALFDLPGTQNLPPSASRSNSLDQFCINFANERLHRWIQHTMFELHAEEYASEGIAARWAPTIPFFDNSECVRVMATKPGGLIHIMDDQARRMPRKNNQTMVEAFGKRWGNHSSFKVGAADRSGLPTFTVNHFNGPVTYSSDGFLERNSDALNPDFVSLLRGSTSEVLSGQESSTDGSRNPFVKGLFNGPAQQPQKPMRAPSTRRKGGTISRRARMPTLGEDGDIPEDAAVEDTAPSGIKCVAGEFQSALNTLFETLDETQQWMVFCINPNDGQLPNQLEGRVSRLKRSGVVWEASMTPAEFLERYKDTVGKADLGEGEGGMGDAERISRVRLMLDVGESGIVVGKEKVFLSHAAFHKLENPLRAGDMEEQKRNRLREMEAEAGFEPRAADPYAPYPSPGMEPNSPYYGGDTFGQSSQALPLVSNAQGAPLMGAGQAYMYDDDKSFQTNDRGETGDDAMSMSIGSESYAPSRQLFTAADRKPVADKEALPGEVMEGETAEEVKTTAARRRWVALCWILTFWVPNFMLNYVGRIKRIDVRQAWREKFAINLIIWFICACAVFVIAVLGVLICPTEHVFSSSELASHSVTNDPNNAYVAVRGEVFDLTQLTITHAVKFSIVPPKQILAYAGTDASKLFPVQVSALCNGVTGSVSPWVTLDSSNQTAIVDAKYHDFRAFTNDPRGDWYYETMVQMRYQWRKGFMGYQPNEIKNMARNKRAVVIIDGMVYEMTGFTPGRRAPDGEQAPQGVDVNFMSQEIINMFSQYSGQDVSKIIGNLGLSNDVLSRQRTCLRNLFLIGKVDHRNSPQCLFATNILLALSIFMVSIIGFKFIAALHFGAPRAPEDHDRFVICQVPCYTEGEESLRRTIDSLAKLRYDDKRKLLFVVCDGMIVGSGNDRPTPRIALDILGADPNMDPEPLSFLSLGDGAKQHNMGKVWSGLYECEGHVVPYIVLAKVGKPTERARPGNRGKRDSQMVLMHFLNKVSSLQLANEPARARDVPSDQERYGVNPTFYEYLLMVDADTTVEPMSLNRLVSAMIHDKKLLGVCGETSIANAKQSIITMMQVYEYFISHHLAKAFESLFGSVTCLPGCFTMYRLRSPDTHKPLFIAQPIIDYSENRVDTLHMKNLLHLGEDRYLTTLLLKHFSNYKTQFVRDAHAYTVAPDEWSVLLSQRRRWINSTIHNLAELVFLDRLCGFCCFSMRFIVFIDLFSTITQPVTVAYIVYLVYLTVGEGKAIPTLSLIMLAAIYGLQALIFIFRRKWDMVGWMIFYILAIPAFSFLLPLYSFWKMDDFSWGSTRLVVGEGNKKMIVHDEGKFDPRAIPLKTWSDYENELWDKESNHSIGSWVPPPKKDIPWDAQSQSAYGRETFYEAPMSRAYSPVPSQGGMYMPAPAYGTTGSGGRGTPVGGRQYAQSTMSRPVTNYLDMPSHMFSGDGPSDQELERGVQDMLRDADMSQVTKRTVRTHLENVFGVNLAARKDFINSVIEREVAAKTAREQSGGSPPRL
ncbi:chitin synthase [Ceratobasidium sp. AG-Ba]|nr:chitin synthase [Ceratobasidium sp. AG-Ba]